MQPTQPWEGAPGLLVVEDDDTVRELLADALRFVGFSVTAVATGPEALLAALHDPPDLIVLDVMLPGLDGFEVVRRLRELDGPAPRVPVLFLSARDAPRDKVNGLALGGDDYVTKPFHLPELVARIRAVLRRAGLPDEGALAVADLRLDPATRRVTRGGEVVKLSPTEFNLLHHLMARAGRVAPKPAILQEVWRYDFAGDTSIVDTYVSYLRRKVDTVEPKLIHTVHGVGYMLRGPER